MDGWMVNSHVRKWLGLPKSVSSIGLYSNGALSLPISSLVEDVKCAKVRLDMSLTDSRDPVLPWQLGRNGPQSQLCCRSNLLSSIVT